VSLDGSSSVAVLTLPDLALERSFDLGDSPRPTVRTVRDLVVPPGQPGTAVVSFVDEGSVLTFAGAAVFRDGVKGSLEVPQDARVGSLEPGPTPDTVWGYDQRTPLADLRLLRLVPDGLAAEAPSGSSTRGPTAPAPR